MWEELFKNDFTSVHIKENKVIVCDSIQGIMMRQYQNRKEALFEGSVLATMLEVASEREE